MRLIVVINQLPRDYIAEINNDNRRDAQIGYIEPKGNNNKVEYKSADDTVAVELSWNEVKRYLTKRRETNDIRLRFNGADRAL